MGVIIMAVVSQREAAPTSATALPPPAFDRPPDLTRMTQREAADRLFNRIMTANEQGRLSEAQRFVPMAVQAYQGLPTLDRDAHYHLSLIHGVAGNRTKRDAHIAALREGAPNHLLALILEHSIARQSRDGAAASRTIAAFAAAYDGEMAKARPEYAAHRKTIERFRAAQLSQPDRPAAGPEAIRQSGAALFAKNCAGCHGEAALGSYKGPPLIHKIYEPSHHGDGAFYRAVRKGVRPHHWRFGPMPPIPGISDEEIRRIIAYVRELQRAAGIR
ncbi:MAG: cytochrome c [Alphaproteobacteria bacterium]|nr:cytochrome c [Alphaproteobacteria bacterium]